MQTNLAGTEKTLPIFTFMHSNSLRLRCLSEWEESEGGCNRTSNFGSRMTLSSKRHQRASWDGSFREGFKNLEEYRWKVSPWNKIMNSFRILEGAYE